MGASLWVPIQHKKLLPMYLNSSVTYECESYRGLPLVTFLGRTRKVTSRRAAPGPSRKVHEHQSDFEFLKILPKSTIDM